MASTIDQELDELLDKYERKQKGKRDNRDEAIAEENAFISEFVEVRSSVLRPAFDRLGRRIRLRGHDFVITEGDFRPPHGAVAKADEAWIRMTIYLAHEQDRTSVGDVRRPFMSFTSDHRAKKAILHTSDYTDTGGQVVKEGEYDLKQLQNLFVQEKFLALFARLARK
jgi:hypothetical protein